MPKPWIATFNGGELVCANQVGLKPLGQVFGCAVRGVSTQFFPATSDEARIESEAFDPMLAESLARIRAEATQLGANAVVGCQVVWTRVDEKVEASDGYYPSTLKISGTAVLDIEARKGEFYIVPASPDEIMVLRRADYIPAGLALGRSTYYQTAWRQVPKMTGGAFSTWANEEVVELTRGPYVAREIAMGRMADMAKAAGAVGIVGVKIATEIHPAGTLQGSTMSVTTRFLCYGTAIRRKPGSIDPVSVTPIIPLS